MEEEQESGDLGLCDDEAVLEAVHRVSKCVDEKSWVGVCVNVYDSRSQTPTSHTSQHHIK
jgi:hypothetical protein